MYPQRADRYLGGPARLSVYFYWNSTIPLDLFTTITILYLWRTATDNPNRLNHMNLLGPYRPRDRYFVHFHGVKFNLHKACILASLPYSAVYRRVRTGLTPQEAFDALLAIKDEETNDDE